jgi:hypothetical protein
VRVGNGHIFASLCQIGRCDGTSMRQVAMLGHSEDRDASFAPLGLIALCVFTRFLGQNSILSTYRLATAMHVEEQG